MIFLTGMRAYSHQVISHCKSQNGCRSQMANGHLGQGSNFQPSLKWLTRDLKVLAHLVYQPKGLIQSCFVHHCHWRHPALASVLASSSVHTSPWHMVRHRNFILGTHMHICPLYMHIKYLMILTCSFKMGAILAFFFDLLSCPHRQSQRLHITYT